MTRSAEQGKAPLMTRAEISGLLAMLAHHKGYVAGESDVYWWREQLAGYTNAECQAAIWALSKTDTRVSPAAIIAQIKGARPFVGSRPLASERFLRGPRRQVDQAAHARAARRGMTAIYARTGWSRDPDQAAALSVACPIPRCAAAAGVICADVGLPEPRDRATRVHPSRVQAGREAGPATAKENSA